MRTLFLPLFALTLLAGSAGPLAAGGQITLLQVLKAIEAAPKDRSAQTLLGTYVKAAIEGAVAAGKQSGSPVICARPGRGSFDAGEFAAFARQQKPTKAS